LNIHSSYVYIYIIFFNTYFFYYYYRIYFRFSFPIGHKQHNTTIFPIAFFHTITDKKYQSTDQSTKRDTMGGPRRCRKKKRRKYVALSEQKLLVYKIPIDPT
jgi:hypothetical protein